MTTRQSLVLIPGLLCDPLLWAPQVEGLADTADIWVAGAGGHDSIAGIAADVLRHCPFERFSLAGLSMGGYVALEMWRQAARRVERLALLDTTARPDAPEAAAARRALMETARAQGLTPVAQALLPRLVWPRAPRSEALAATVRTMAWNVGVDAFLRQEAAIIGRADSRDTLPRIDCPALVACGNDDILTPPAVHEEMAAGIPGATLVRFEDCGHLSTLERPDDVNHALRAWLDR
ncbi:alpha/beta fold hydrolase [Pigmentiphaga soli]|uniref:Alpha/beta fold hydrolase n=1 Tax=Pigmentiphaga soli TaxID=1007095 RepID=A0ABP8GT00_9BURK